MKHGSLKNGFCLAVKHLEASNIRLSSQLVELFYKDIHDLF